MPDVTPQQIRKLGTHALTRDGIDLTSLAAQAVNPMACWNFALTGTFLGMAHNQSPDSIYSSSGVGQNPVNAILDINIYPIACNGLRATATAANHPGCAAELLSLNHHMGNAIAGNALAQQACAEAMATIVANKNGLVSGVADDKYQLHMVGTNWFSWDHWALSVRAEQAGRPRIFVQTVTGVPLAHACDRIWDEHLPSVVVLNLQELHAAQIVLINLVTDFGNLCVGCGAGHGYLTSRINLWHRCAGCHAVYCPTCGGVLAGKQGWSDGTRACSQLGCFSRTVLIGNV